MKLPMKTLVERVSIACDEWLETDDLPSPPATAALLRSSDAALARAIADLCASYPRQMSAALKDQAND